VKESILNQGGYTGIILLIVMPLLMVMLLGSVELTNISNGSNVDVKKAVEQGTKAAAMSVNERSQANGTPYITPNLAYLQFKSIMTANLGLQSDWTPLSNSTIAEVLEYQFAVINGTNGYESTGMLYSNSDTGIDLAYLGLPKLADTPVTIGVGDSGLVFGGTATLETDIRTPSCIGWVRLKLKNAITDTDEVVVRWGIGRIVNKNIY